MIQPQCNGVPLRVATITWFFLLLEIVMPANAQKQKAKPRARDLGIPFDGAPGPLNTITDVKGVEVGHTR